MLKKRELLSFVLAFSIVFSTVFAAAPAEAKWDDTYEQTEGAEIEPVYGLITTQWLSYYNDDRLLLLEGYPAEAREWDDNGPVQDTLQQIDYTDFKNVTPKGSYLWLDYRASVTGKRTHASADDITVKYYGDTEPSDENAEPQTVTGLLNDAQDKLVSFVPATNKFGYYTLSYKDAANEDEYLTIFADYPTIGFYSQPERSVDNLLLDDFSDNNIRNLPLYYDNDNAIYMNAYGNDETTELSFPADDAEDCEPAFRLWIRNDDAGVPQTELTGGADGIEDYFSVEEIESEGNDCWYKLTFNNLPMKNEDGEVAENEDGETIFAKGFDCKVSMLRTNRWEEDGEPREETWMEEAWINAVYRSLGLTAKADGMVIGDTSAYINIEMVYPNHFVVSFENTSLDEDGNVQSEPVDIKKLKVEKDKNFGTDKEGENWGVASEDECTITTKGNEVDCVFHYQGNWRFSFGTEEYIYFHNYLGDVEFWEQPNRPADDQPIGERLVAATVDEGSTKKIYALAWRNDEDAMATKIDTIKIKAVANDKDVSDTYIKVDETPTTGDGFFGYGITITDAAAEDFKIIITAERNGKVEGCDDICCEFPVNVNSIKELTIATPPTKTNYNEGDSFNAAGMVVNAVYEDGSKKAITGYTVSATKALTASDKTVTISYRGKNVTQAITVNPKKTTVPGGNATSAPGPLAKGKKVTDSKTGNIYKVTKSDKKNPAVEYTAPKKGAKNTVTIPDTVTIDGIKYNVTTIAANAFKNNKKITKIVIGKNIAGIGKNAFSGCKKLKTIIIKSTKLTSKNVKKDAFKGIPKKTVIQVPKKSLKSYKKLFPKKGLNKKIKIKK